MADIELVVIDADTKLRDFKDRLRWNDARPPQAEAPRMRGNERLYPEWREWEQ